MKRAARRIVRVLGWASAPAVVLAVAAVSAAQTKEVQEELFRSVQAARSTFAVRVVDGFSSDVIVAGDLGQRFTFKIDAKTPMKDLLPPAPKRAVRGPWLEDDLRRVPEVGFMEPLVSKGRSPAQRQAERTKLTENTAHVIAKINHLNQRKTDYFLEQLLSRRGDLAGLPFLKGQACRQSDARRPAFTQAVNGVRAALQQSEGVMTPALPQPKSDTFWQVYRSQLPASPVGAGAGPLADATDKSAPQDEATAAEAEPARIAALMQMLAPETHLHPGLVQRLKDLKDTDATLALARLAVFAPEEDARKAALAALQNRTANTKEIDELLLQAFRYPWPQIAGRAADAAVALKRSRLVPRLVDLLDQPDPREPVRQDVDGQETTVVRELVRLNHHQNCLMCHAPGNTRDLPGDAATGAVPIPGQPLPTPSQGYDFSIPDILVRADVTYLRPDFSVLQPVANADPWPKLQRFDFLVRTRELNEKESALWRELIDSRPADYVSPYQTAVSTALRGLTGQDAGLSAPAWRRALRLPAAR